MQFLRANTASQEISLGQFLDSTDGNTEEGGLTIANTDIKLRKHNTTTLANKNSGGATVISNGVYQCTLDATDSNTAGMLEIYVHVAGALAVKSVFMVLTATAFDALFTGTFNNLGGTAQTTDHTAGIADIPTVAEFNARTLVAASYFDPAADTVANVTLVATTTTNTDMRGTNSAALATALATVDSNVDAILVDTGTTIPTQLDSMSGATFSTSTDSLEAIRNRGDAAWTTGAGGSAPTVIEIREEMDSNSTQLAAIVLDTGTTLPSQITALNNVAATDIVSNGAITTLSGAVVNVDLVDVTTTNTDMIAGFATASALAIVDSNVDSILVDTATTIPALIAALNDISAAQVNAECDTAISDAALATAAALATVDNVVDAIKIVTDKFVFTIANQVDSNIQSINDVAITGDGSGSPFDV